MRFFSRDHPDFMRGRPIDLCADVTLSTLPGRVIKNQSRRRVAFGIGISLLHKCNQ
jgi:hypothetical protein